MRQSTIFRDRPQTPSRLWQLVMVLGLFALTWSPPRAQAAAQRCLQHQDCPTGYNCINRICVKGLVVSVGGHKTAAYKVAIPKPRWYGPLSARPKILLHAIWMQLINNFKLLPGTFQVLPSSSYIERPPYNGVDLGTFYFSPWSQIQASGLIKVGLSKLDQQHFNLKFRYYDVDEQKLVVRSDQTIQANQYRWTIHQLCDRIYRYLTNQPGIFSSMIAYVKRNRKGGKDIWISDIDGANRRRVISNGSINVLPHWSPDGKSLLFTSYLTGGAYLYRLDIPTRKVVRISRRPGTYTGAVYSPKGDKIAFSMTPRHSNGASDIYVSRPDGTQVQRLTSSWGIDVSPSWSPDGKQIAFVSERFATPQIFMMNADGSNQTRLTFKGNYNQEPRWSPRGNEILFTARDEFLQYDLFVIRLDKDKDGTLKPSYRRLTQNQGTNLEATWSPDGRYILYVSTRVGERKLFIMNLDGSHQKLFLRGWGNFASPAWSPLMKKPIIPGGSVGRTYYRRVKWVGVRKTVDGDYVAVQPNKRPTTTRKSPHKPTPRTQPRPPASRVIARTQPKTQPTRRAAKTAPSPTTARRATISSNKASKNRAAKPTKAKVRKPPSPKRPAPKRHTTPKQLAPRTPARATATPTKSPKTRTTPQKRPTQRSQPAKRREG